MRDCASLFPTRKFSDSEEAPTEYKCAEGRKNLAGFVRADSDSDDLLWGAAWFWLPKLEHGTFRRTTLRHCISAAIAEEHSSAPVRTRAIIGVGRGSGLLLALSHGWLTFASYETLRRGRHQRSMAAS